MKKLLFLIFTFVLSLSLAACGNTAADSWQQQYDLGVKYLSELNYEEAVVAFTKAIEIDPKQADAYAELAKVYAAQGDTAGAQKVIEDAKQQLGTDNQTVAEAEEELGLADRNGSQNPSAERAAARSEESTSANGERTITTEYDQFGVRMSRTEKEANGDIVNYTEYDENGYIVYMYSYTGPRRIYSQTFYENNENGKPVISKNYDENMQLVFTTEYEYYPSGNDKTWTTYDANGEIFDVQEFEDGPII